MRVLRIAYVYIHGVGILFLHCSSHKAFGDAPVHGRKTTSLTSFLFLYPLLIATVRRLEWRKKSIVIMRTNDLIAESLRNPETPDLQEFVFIFYLEANTILWNYLAREPCSKICLVKWDKENRDLFDEVFCWDEKEFFKPFKLKIKLINNGRSFYYQFEDFESRLPNNLENGNTIEAFIEVFINNLHYPSKLW